MYSLHDSLDETMPEDLPVSIAPNLTRFKARLLELGYSQHDRERIAGYAGELGTLEGCAEVEPDDRAELDAILERSWPAVPITSRAWDDGWATPRQVTAFDGTDRVGVIEEWGDRLPACWTLARPDRIAAIAEVAGAEARAVGVELVPPELDDVEPYEPTEEDWAAYRAMLAESGDFDDLVGPGLTLYDLPELEPFQS